MKPSQNKIRLQQRLLGKSKSMFRIALFVLSAGAVHAQGNEVTDTVRMDLDKLINLSFEDLMNVSVVTPTKSIQKTSQAPSTVLVVTMDQIKLRGYRNLAEVLNDLPDFIVQDKSDPQSYNVVNVRGISAQDRFIILLDGVKISSPTNERIPLLENFPIYLARQIEVVYGPGSALYGADAMGGVINIITQKAEAGKDMTITAMGGSQGYTNATAVFNQRLKNKVKFTIGGQYSYDVQPDFSKIYKEAFNIASHRSGTFNTFYGPVTSSQPVSGDYSAPIRAYNVYSSIDKGGFSMKLLHHYIQTPTSTTLSPENAVYNKDVFYGQGVTTAGVSYKATLGNFESISSFAGSFYQVNPRSNFRNVYGGIQHGYKFSTGSMLKAEEQFLYSFKNKVTVTAGLTYELFQSVPKTPELESPVNRKLALTGILLNTVSENNPAGIEAKFFPLLYTNLGAYTQVQYTPAKAISLTAGTRFDNNSRFGSTFNPRVGAVLTMFGNTTVKALYGTAFWAPSPMVSFESYGSFYPVENGNTYRSSFWHLPNPGLKPMISHTVELSIRQKIGTDLSVTVSTYKTHVHDIIQNVPDNGNTNLYNNTFLGFPVDYIEVPFNVGTQDNHGGNLAVNHTFRYSNFKFNLYSSVSYVEGKVQQYNASAKLKEVEQTLITPWQYRIGLDGKLNAFHFSTRLLHSGEQRMASFVDPANPDKRNTIKGYSLLNISAGYTVKDRATFFINVQNALNQRYMNSISWDSPETDGSLQDPMRVTTGVRLAL
jgi:outer membrane cobalamin receptor